MVLRPLFCLAIAANAAWAAKDLRIWFVDVEIGNAVLLVAPSGQSLLMDAGSHLASNRDRDRVLAVLHAAGLKRLDYVLATHYHNDHYGAIADIADQFPISNFVDHGPSVEYGKPREWWLRYFSLWPHDAAMKDLKDQQFDRYREITEKAHHIVVKPGDKIPIEGLDVTVVTSAGDHLKKPMHGAGAPNPGCGITSPRSEDPTEDGQSVGLVIQYGKFRFINLGDLTWNKSMDLFCPANPIGKVDLYMVTHHGMSDPKEVGEIDWGRSCCNAAELRALSPRVAVESGGRNYHKGSSPLGWQAVRATTGLEDIWQTNGHPQGGKENNAPEQFVANIVPEGTNPGVYSIEVTAERDGTFTVNNERNHYGKTYHARP
jgi:competence protein ComEC